MLIYLLRHGIAEDARPAPNPIRNGGTRREEETARGAPHGLARGGVTAALILSRIYRRALETAKLAAGQSSATEDNMPQHPGGCLPEPRLTRSGKSFVCIGIVSPPLSPGTNLCLWHVSARHTGGADRLQEKGTLPLHRGAERPRTS